jgi:hypothetical protein
MLLIDVICWLNSAEIMSSRETKPESFLYRVDINIGRSNGHGTIDVSERDPIDRVIMICRVR